MSNLLKSPSVQFELIDGSKKLFLIFGGKNTGVGMPPFEFVRSSEILDESRIFIRDLKQSWYHNGLEGITTDIPSTALYLKELVKTHPSKELILVGNSMGGFAAILFASMLDGSRAIAFAPQTFIDPVKRIRHRDNRWQREIIATYRRALFRKKYFDLSKLENSQINWKADIIVSGNHRLDLAHAMNLQSIPQVSVKKIDFCGHRLVLDLRDRGYLKDILEGNMPT